MEIVTVRVPASTSNLGPGYDCLGIALRLYNRVTVTRTAATGTNGAMADAAAEVFFRAAGCESFPFHFSATGDVPRARGLGSSVTVRLGLLHGLNVLAKRPLSRQAIFELCAELEGHPDNAAPAEFGGFNVVRHGSRQSFSVSPKLRFILLIPDFEIETVAARTILPAEIPRLGAVESCGNAAAITAAFASRQYENLRGCFVDHLHQPYRQKLIPCLPDVIAAAEKAGALGGFLSGSGSTIACLTLKNPKAVAAAMLAGSGLANARMIFTTADNRGSRIEPSRTESKIRHGPQA